MSKDLYIDHIQNAHLSDASKLQYTTQLKKLQNITKNNLDWIIEHPKETAKYVNALYSEPQTKGALLASVLALFKHVPNLKETKNSLYKSYREIYDEIYLEIEKKYRSGLASEKQQKGFVPWTTIIETRDTLAKTQFASKAHLLVSMYTWLKPLRQDFGKVEILDKMPNDIDAKNGNFIFLAKNDKLPSFLVLNEYKTSKAFHQFKKELCRELIVIIRASLLLSPRKYLFVDSQGVPYEKENSYIKATNRLLKELFGKPLTVSLIRHSWSTYENTLNVNHGEVEDAAKDMLHSGDMHRRYVFLPIYPALLHK
jgi:hypothetical protein